MLLTIPSRSFEHAQIGALLPRLAKETATYHTLRKSYQTWNEIHLRRRYIHHHLTNNLPTLFALYGLTLQHNQKLVAFDGLVITPHVLFLLETKASTRNVRVNDDGILFNIDEQTPFETTTIMKQANEKKQFLASFLQHHDFPAIPIHPITVITDPKTHMLSNIKHPDVIHISKLFYYMAALTEVYPYAVYSPGQLADLHIFMPSTHYVDPIHIIEKYGIADQAIRKGVWCPTCKEAMMIRAQGYWVCSGCASRSHDAHVQTLREFALLYRTTITNKEARYFLQISSPAVVKRIFAEAKIQRLERPRSHTYQLNGLFYNRKQKKR